MGLKDFYTDNKALFTFIIALITTSNAVYSFITAISKYSPQGIEDSSNENLVSQVKNNLQQDFILNITVQDITRISPG